MDKTTELLDSMSALIAKHTKAAAVLSARAMVLGKFLDATFLHLTQAQSAEIRKSFRAGVEDSMAMMDDVPLSADYHASLLELTNSILEALAQRGAGNS
ncbi:hypothetical protein [Paraburkholderia phytofirmans]|nr:hypothetical protein [Paraburkholderia phytofirmans]